MLTGLNLEMIFEEGVEFLPSLCLDDRKGFDSARAFRLSPVHIETLPLELFARFLFLVQQQTIRRVEQLHLQTVVVTF